MTPEELRRLADEKETEAKKADDDGRAALDRGEAKVAAGLFILGKSLRHQAEVRRLAADEMDRIGEKSLASHSQDVHTGSDVNTNFAKDVLARRGRGVARAYAKKSKNWLYTAIEEDLMGSSLNEDGIPVPAPRWRSGADYAERSLKVSQSALTGYLLGRTAVPRRVDTRVAKDFPLAKRRWPKGVVD